MRAELRALSKDNADRVAAHLVAAGTLLEQDPEASYAHAKAAVRRAGRIAAVREALGIVAYHLENYEEAIRELRTHRRISGVNDNVALLADAERGRDRPAKALEIFAETDLETLPLEVRTELVLVAAGAHTDRGDVAAARALLEAQDFRQRASGSLVRLQSAYSDLLRLDGEPGEADKWEELARRTAAATGTVFGDEEIDPNADIEILTIEDEADDAAETEGAAGDGDASDEAEGAFDDATASADGTGEALQGDSAVAEEPAGEGLAAQTAQGAPAQDEAAQAGPAQAESTSDEPAQAESVADRPAQDEPAADEPTSDERTDVEADAEARGAGEPVEGEPAQGHVSPDVAVPDEPAHEESARSETAQDYPAQDEPALFEPAQDEPALFELDQDDAASDESAPGVEGGDEREGRP